MCLFSSSVGTVVRGSKHALKVKRKTKDVQYIEPLHDSEEVHHRWAMQQDLEAGVHEAGLPQVIESAYAQEHRWSGRGYGTATY